MTEPLSEPPTSEPTTPTTVAANLAVAAGYAEMPDAKFVVLIEDAEGNLGLATVGFRNEAEVVATMLLEAKSLRIGAGLTEADIQATAEAKWGGG